MSNSVPTPPWLVIPRRAQALADATEATGAKEAPDERPMRDWRELDAYVLLGDPGAGKTAVFKSEAAEEAGAIYVTARNFIAGHFDEERGQVLYIDGLDEERAGGRDGRSKLDEILARLKALDRPRFRLSCRAADWLGLSDARALNALSPGVKVLQLLPLADREIVALLRDVFGVADPEGFIDQARGFGIGDLLGNPLLLRLTVNAVRGGKWPATRQEVYQDACNQMVLEDSSEHRAAWRNQDSITSKQRLDTAGRICAALLLSGKAGVEDLADLAGTDRERVETVSRDQLAGELATRSIEAALSTKLFTTVDGISQPLHRSIAEFLAARHLAILLDQGLPLDRLLALICGDDGRPVAPLRGLLGWLASIRQAERERLLALDPFAVVLNGDVAQFDDSEKSLVIASLASEPVDLSGSPNERQPYLGLALAPLAMPSMVPTLRTYLEKEDPAESHQRLLSWLLEALLHGQPLPALAPSLEKLVTSASTHPDNRIDAYRCWTLASFQLDTALSWLERLKTGELEDPDRTLLGWLLKDLYPAHLRPGQVFDFLVPAPVGVLGEYKLFWNDLVDLTPQDQLTELAQGWISSNRKLSSADLSGIDVTDLVGRLIVALLEAFGEAASIDVLDGWLRLGLAESGLSVTELRGSRSGIASWLERHPQRMLELLARGYEGEARRDRDEFKAWRAEAVLHGATLPRSIIQWNLERAATASGARLAEFHLRQAISLSFNQAAHFDCPPLEVFEAVVEDLSARFPAAPAWLADAWTSNFPGYKTLRWPRRHQRELDKAREREERRAHFEAELPRLLAGLAPLAVLSQVVAACEGRYVDVAGASGEEKVAAFLVTDKTTALKVLSAIEGVLKRDDLPVSPDTLTRLTKGQRLAEGPVFLFAADRVFAADPEALLALPEDRIEQLMAFELAHRFKPSPWVAALAAARPKRIADIVERFARHELPRLTEHQHSRIALLLSGEVRGLEPVIRRALGAVLANFPPRQASAPGLAALDRLLGSIGHLEPASARQLVADRLADDRLAAGQRSSWLVANLGLAPHDGGELPAWVGSNQRRATAIGDAIVRQAVLDRLPGRLAPSVLRPLIEILAGVSPAGPPSGVYRIDAGLRRGGVVSQLIDRLEDDGSPEAGRAIASLLDSDRLQRWHRRLQRAATNQRALAREANFQAASPEAIQKVLENRDPANPADLQAFILDHLSEVEAELRGADTYLLRQFWGFGGQPLDENDSRDLLLQRLRDRLKLTAVSLNREASAAADKRADTRAEVAAPGVRVAVPIEVKKDSHAKLWTAWRDQLDLLYTTDPNAAGYGIYLVLWFGIDCRPSPQGLRPTSAQALQAALQQCVSDANRGRLAVRVIDLSAVPGAAPASARSARKRPAAAATSRRRPATRAK